MIQNDRLRLFVIAFNLKLKTQMATDDDKDRGASEQQVWDDFSRKLREARPTDANEGVGAIETVMSADDYQHLKVKLVDAIHAKSKVKISSGPEGPFVLYDLDRPITIPLEGRLPARRELGYRRFEPSRLWLSGRDDLIFRVIPARRRLERIGDDLNVSSIGIKLPPRESAVLDEPTTLKCRISPDVDKNGTLHLAVSLDHDDPQNTVRPPVEIELRLRSSGKNERLSGCSTRLFAVKGDVPTWRFDVDKWPGGNPLVDAWWKFERTEPDVDVGRLGDLETKPAEVKLNVAGGRTATATVVRRPSTDPSGIQLVVQVRDPSAPKSAEPSADVIGALDDLRVVVGTQDELGRFAARSNDWAWERTLIEEVGKLVVDFRKVTLSSDELKSCRVKLTTGNAWRKGAVTLQDALRPRLANPSR